MSGQKVTFHKLILEGFGPYRDPAEFNFSGAINCYVASNESGKTTMAAGLIAVIFGLSHRPRAGSPFSLDNFRNWEGPARCCGEVFFTSADEHYQIVRDFDTHKVELWSLEGDFGGRKLLIGGQHNPGASKRLKAYEDEIQKLLGLSTQELFSDTFCVGQPLPEPKNISAELQGLLSGGKGASFHLALKGLLDNLKVLTKLTGPNDRGITARNMGKDGLLEQTEQQITLLAQQLEGGRQVADSLEETRKQLALVDQGFGKQKEELAKKGKLRQAWSNWKLLQSEYRSAAERRDKLKKAEKEAGVLKGKLDGLKGKLEKYYPEFNAAPAETGKILEELVWLDKQMKELSGTIQGLEELSKANNKKLAALKNTVDEKYSGWEQLGADAVAGLKTRRKYVETCQKQWQQFSQNNEELKELDSTLENTFAAFENAPEEELELIRGYDRRSAELSNAVRITMLAWESTVEQKTSFEEAKSAFAGKYAELSGLPDNAGEIVSEKISAMEEKERLGKEEKRFSRGLVPPVWLRYGAILLAAGLAGFLVGTANITITVLAAVAAALAGHWIVTSIYNLLFSRGRREFAQIQEKLRRCEKKISDFNDKLGSFAGADELQLGRLVQQLEQYAEDKRRLENDEKYMAEDRLEKIKGEWEKAREEKAQFDRLMAPFTNIFADPPAALNRWQSLKEKRGRLRTGLNALAHETWGCNAEAVATKAPLSENVAEHWQETARFLQLTRKEDVFADQNVAGLVKQLSGLTGAWWQQQEIYTTVFAKIRNDISDLEYELTANNKQLDDNLGKKQGILDQLGQVDEKVRQVVEENENNAALALERWKSRRQIMDEEGVVLGQLETLLGNNDVETADQLQSKLSRAQDSTSAAMLRWKEQIDRNPGLPGVEQADDLEQINSYLEKIEGEIGQLEKDKNGLEQSRRALIETLASLEGQTPLNIASAEIELAELKVQKESIEINADALEMAYKELQAAIIDYRQTYRERLEKQTTKYCQAISGIPHRHVELGEDFAVSIREGGRPCSVDQLSKGARDQLYLSLRFAVADLLAEEVKLPFIFDDSFTSTDAHRCENIRQVLQQRAGERQFIILAHSDAFTTWGTPIGQSRAEN